MRLLNKLSVVFVGVSVVLSGCTTIAEIAVEEAKSNEPTPYRAQGGLFQKDGYSEEQQIDGTLKIEFRGNALTTPKWARDVVRYRAAEVGRERGFSYFALLNSNSGVGCTKARQGLQVWGLGVLASASAKYGAKEDFDGEVFSVDDTLSSLRDRVLTPAISEDEEERNYSSNRLTCINEEVVEPEGLYTYDELVEKGIL